MSKKLPRFTKKRNSYYYTPTIDGKTKWLPLGKDQVKAMLKYNQYEAGTKEVTVNQLLDYYVRSDKYLKNGLSIETIRTYEIGMKHVRCSLGNAAAASLNGTDISRFIESRPGSSGNSCVSPLSNAYQAGIPAGLVSATPFKKGDIVYKKTPVRVKVVEADEIKRVREEICMEGRVFIDITLITALRRSDVMALTKDNVTEKGLEVAVRKKRSKHQVLIFPWTPELRYLMNFLPFITNPNAMSQRFARAGKRAGVDDLTCHDLRRWALQEAKRRNLKPQELAGHDSPRTTANYLLGIPTIAAPLHIQGRGFPNENEKLAGSLPVDQRPQREHLKH